MHAKHLKLCKPVYKIVCTAKHTCTPPKHTHTHTHTHTKYFYTHTNTAHAHAHTHVYILHTHTHTYIHTHTLVCTHTHIYTYIHTLKPGEFSVFTHLHYRFGLLISCISHATWSQVQKRFLISQYNCICACPHKWLP